MIKNVKIRVLALIIASVMLGGALMVAAIMGSPYETLKKAALDALTYRNVTTEGQFTLSINGEIYDEKNLYYINGDNSSLDYYNDENGSLVFNYTSNNISIRPDYIEENGKQWYSAHIRYDYYNNAFVSSGPFGMFNPEERDSAGMRFMEMVVDALVGNLKNNITMSTNGGRRYIQGTLTENQVPEIVKAGIDVLVEQSGNDWYYSCNERKYDFDGYDYIYENIRICGKTKDVYVFKQPVRVMTDYEMETWDFPEQWGTSSIDGKLYVNTASNYLINEYTAPVTLEDFDDKSDPLSIPMESLTINYLRGEAEIDEDGNLLSFEVNATVTIVNILGETNVLEFKYNARFSDIGTSKAVCPIPGAEQLLTPEYITGNFGNNYHYGVIYFTLNEEGSIDASSVTTTYPGQLEFDKYNYSYNSYMEAVEVVEDYLRND